MRSVLQTEDDPACPGDPSGLHCRCIDSHDSCCDCNIEITDDGDARFPVEEAKGPIAERCKVAGYTPRPWAITKAGTYEFYEDEWYVDGDGKDIGAVAIVNGEANARIIVVAPDLLEALERAILPYHGREMTNATAAWVLPARVAIAKAKGLTE